MRHWYTRYRISSALDEGTLANLVDGHLSRCSACQAHARDLQSLHARLSLGAPSAPPPALSAASRRRRPLLVAAPLAAAFAAAIAFSVGPSTPTPEAPVVPAPYTLDLRDLTQRVSALLATRDVPLDAELENLIHDGRRGLDEVLSRSGLRQ